MTENIDDTIQLAIAASLNEELTSVLSEEEFLEWLSSKINDMIVQDFEKFLSLLYIIDIDEKKVKESLKSNEGKYAGRIIAEMIIKRQQQKKYWREYFKKTADTSLPDEDRW